MSKTIVDYGSVITPELINSLNTHNHLGLDLDGSNSRITNAELSTAPGQILGDFYGFLGQLQVVPSLATLKVKVNSGQVLTVSGELKAISEQEISLLDNAQQLILINQSGLIERSLELPFGAVALARVQCQSGAILGIQDLRPKTTLILPLGQSSQGQTSQFSEVRQQFEQFRAFGDLLAGALVSLRPDGQIEKLNSKNWRKWIGITQIAALNGQFAPVALPSQIDRTRLNLVPGQDYFIQYSNGQLLSTKSLSSFYAGKALSPNSLLLASLQVP